MRRYETRIVELENGTFYGQIKLKWSSWESMGEQISMNVGIEGFKIYYRVTKEEAQRDIDRWFDNRETDRKAATIAKYHPGKPR